MFLPKPDERPAAHQRGYGHKWKLARDAWFDAHPGVVCACGCGQPVNKHNADLDHIVPVKGPADPLFWKPSNWQPMLHGHHSRKTSQKDGGWGNPVRREK
jgi:5-methylcytosine-specific restriction protein A